MLRRIRARYAAALVLSLSMASALAQGMGAGMGTTAGHMGEGGSQIGQTGQVGMMGAGFATGHMGPAGNMNQGGHMDLAGAMSPSGGMHEVGSTGRQVFRPGWNLAGNTGTTAISVAATFGSDAIPVQGATSNILTIWKWDASSAGWQFYAPSLDSASLADYAAGKGYGVLTTIEPGEGYWVNAIGGFSLGDPNADRFAAPPAPGAALEGADPFVLTDAHLLKGWNLVATGIAMHPRQLNSALGATPPGPGEPMQKFESLWAWDNATNRWYFYAPSLDTGGSEMTDYIASKGYLDFTAHNKTLGKGMGFWLNKP